MTLPPAPQAARLRRPSWRDTRLLIGVLLVLASVLVGARVLAAADDSVPVWAARVTLTPGTEVRPDLLTEVRVQLGSGAAGYLSAVSVIRPGFVVLRTVGAGELVPRSALGITAELNRRPVAVPVAGPVPAGVAPGGLVDLWVSVRDRSAGADSYAAPRRIVEAAEVASVSRQTGALAGADTASVELLLKVEQLPAVLDALANEAKTALVPLPGTAPVRDNR